MSVNRARLPTSHPDESAEARIKRELLKQMQRYTPGQQDLPYVYGAGRGYTFSTLNNPTMDTPLTSWPATPNMGFKQGYKLRRKKTELRK